MGFVVQFDATKVAPNVTPEPIPSGIYTAAIVASDEKAAKNTPGATFYELTQQILDGEFKGRKITDRLNCKNPNPTAVDIAYGTLSAICHVTGVLNLNNSQELHGKPFKINVVKIPRNDDPSRMTNEIRGYLHMDGTEPGKSGTNGAAVATPPPGFATGAPAANGFATTAPATVAPAAPVAAPAFVPPAPVAAAPPPPAPVAAPFPPEGWLAHPQSPGYYYKGQEVLTEAELRVKSAAAPAAPIPAAFQPPAPAAAAPTAPAGNATPSWAM